MISSIRTRGGINESFISGHGILNRYEISKPGTREKNNSFFFFNSMGAQIYACCLRKSPFSWFILCFRLLRDPPTVFSLLFCFGKKCSILMGSRSSLSPHTRATNEALISSCLVTSCGVTWFRLSRGQPRSSSEKAYGTPQTGSFDLSSSYFVVYKLKYCSRVSPTFWLEPRNFCRIFYYVRYLLLLKSTPLAPVIEEQWNAIFVNELAKAIHAFEILACNERA